MVKQLFFVAPLVWLTFTCSLKDPGNMENKLKVRIETSYGNIDLRLYDDTPAHRDNFIKLVNEGFYDGLHFHRVINNFMIQGGDPGSRNADHGNPIGSGGPGYTIPAEIDSRLFHKKGALAAARLGDNINPDRESSGSQFYIVHGALFDDNKLDEMELRINNQKKQQFSSITFKELEQEYLNDNKEPDYQEITDRVNQITHDHFVDSNLFRFSAEQREAYKTTGGAPHLDGAYTVFGETIDGFDVIDKIASAETNSSARPLKDIIMKIILID